MPLLFSQPGKYVRPAKATNKSGVTVLEFGFKIKTKISIAHVRQLAAKQLHQIPKTKLHNFLRYILQTLPNSTLGGLGKSGYHNL